VRGLRLLDVGCGTGYFAREMAHRGAAVTAVDLSPGMLAHAQELESTAPLGIRYLNGDAARLRKYLDIESFDMATSCLALQDMPNIPKVLRSIHDVLAPGGRLIASIAHPCSDTPFRTWAKDVSGAKQWLCIDRYFDRGPMKYAWKGWLYEFATSAYPATLEDWFGRLIDADFAVLALREPAPTASALQSRPDLQDAARIPYYLMFDLERRR
jgi:ubiquinone/menaquinone biosynthesis C-methylase UbiE